MCGWQECAAKNKTGNAVETGTGMWDSQHVMIGRWAKAFVTMMHAGLTFFKKWVRDPALCHVNILHRNVD